MKRFPLIDNLVWFITERWAIHQQRLLGRPSPWTSDRVLRSRKFCQVLREDDRTTRWIHHEWLRPNDSDPNLWHAMCVARIFNLPQTLNLIGYPEPWGDRRKSVIKIIKELKAENKVVYNSRAYSIRCGSNSLKVSGPLLDWHVKALDSAWSNRDYVQPVKGDTLQGIYARLSSQFGFKKFMAAQILSDVKHGSALRKAKDWSSFAVAGTGGIRGINRVCGFPVDTRKTDKEYRDLITDIRGLILPKLPSSLRNMDAHNVEGNLCEFDKWCRGLAYGRPFTPRPNYFGVSS